MDADLLTLVIVTDPHSRGGDRTTVNKIPIFRWNGEYFGFMYSNRLFDANSNYLGWVENDGRVWRSNGVFLGEVVDNNYILKRTNSVELSPKVSRHPPTPPVPPPPEPNRAGRNPKFCCQDALEEF